MDVGTSAGFGKDAKDRRAKEELYTALGVKRAAASRLPAPGGWVDAARRSMARRLLGFQLTESLLRVSHPPPGGAPLGAPPAVRELKPISSPRPRSAGTAPPVTQPGCPRPRDNKKIKVWLIGITKPNEPKTDVL